MPLTLQDLEGFDAAAVSNYLNSLDIRTAGKGERYYRNGAVEKLECEVPGGIYLAVVQGSYPYKVTMYSDPDDQTWYADCSCPMQSECKHVYAAFKKLLAEAARLGMIPEAGQGAVRGREPEAASGFAAVVEQKLGRKLASNERHYVRKVEELFQQARNGGVYYEHHLKGLGVAPSGHWGPVELFPEIPENIQAFWNFLALYLTEEEGQALPEFMLPVTDLAQVRAARERQLRAVAVQRWSATLAQLDNPFAAGAHPAADGAVKPVELRVRWLDWGVVIEWRLVGEGAWTELKPRKADDFETRYADGLSAEAGLIWMSWLQCVRYKGITSFGYDEVAEQFGQWLRQPLLRPFFTAENGTPLVFHDAPLRWEVTQPENDEGDYSFALVQADGKTLPEVWLAVPGRPAYYVTPAGVFTGPPFEPCLMGEQGATRIPAKAFESGPGLRLLARLQAPPPPRLAARLRTVKLRPGVRAEVAPSWTGQTEICEMRVYGASEDGEYAEYWEANQWMPGEQRRGKSKERDFIQFDRTELEGLVATLDRSGFKWDYQQRRWHLRVSKKFPEAFATFLKALPAATRIELRGELSSFQNAAVAGTIRLEAAETETDWFDLRVIVDVSDTTLTPAEVKLLLDAKGNWVRLGKKGWRKLEYSLSPEEDGELARLGLTPHELTSEPQRLHAFQLADRAARKFLPGETCDRIERRAAELQAQVTPPVPAAIRAELRPYQRDGFHFLAYLSANRFGGILADDMGLGKTLQTLSWLAWLRAPGTGEANGNGKAAGPSLVVCPKSVADNWQAEAAKFFPDLKVRVWNAGDVQTMAEQLANADLHVVNYSQLRLVGSDLAGREFQAVILDEGQYIKNPTSQTAKVTRQLRCRHRLILTGTPIENRLLDLWSLMSFAMPGALGTRAEFGRIYDAKNDPLARQRLSARVRPFLIRRTKAQVARDLPDRVEEDLFCELEGEQKSLYRAELKRAQAMLLGVTTAAALNKQRFNFLTSLLRLRQICCHPKLVQPASKAPSAKLEALFETLEPLIEDGEKVLVFSQFVGLLELLRAETEERGWPSWYLAGDTENRGDLVREFQAAAGAGVFLISLKAGGFGLNLTAASYVVLFDPWWNPAVENQAIDRTHRIGQEQKVIAYRLLIKDSIEEKIRALQKRKSSLAEDVLGEEKFAQALSLDDLRYLLES